MDGKLKKDGPTCPSCGFKNLQGEDRCSNCLSTLVERDLPKSRRNDALQNAMMTTPVSDLLTGEDLLVAHPGDSVQKIVEIFYEKKKGCVLIYDNHKLRGIVSKRDILFRAACKYDDLSKITAEEIMTPTPGGVRPDAPVAYAVNVMALGGFRHVPVLASDASPLSIISVQDVMSFLMKSEQTG